jgi:hypothetical protein
MPDDRFLAVLSAALAYGESDPNRRSPMTDEQLSTALAELSEDEVYTLRDAAHSIERAAKHEGHRRAEARHREKVEQSRPPLDEPS